MSKIDEIRSAMVAAMKAGEKEKKEKTDRQTCRSDRRRRDSGYHERNQADKRDFGDDTC